MPGYVEQAGDVGFRESSDFGGVEAFEGFAECVALAQDNDPGKSGLKSFEHQQFPQGAAVAHGTPHSVSW